MAVIPVDKRLLIEQLIEDRMVGQDMRPYLGISSIGHPCLRHLWYNFRLCAIEQINARKARLFSRGHREEPIIVADLARVGVLCHSDQKGCVTGHGHIRGHIDGILERVPDAPKTPHLGEYKTANAKNFKDMVAKGLKASKPIYYAQTQCYMSLLDLTRTLFIMACKDDDSRYYERIRLDKSDADYYLERGLAVISSEVPLDKMPGASATWFECKWCKHYLICHFDGSINKSCRTCQSCDICDEGKWECTKHKIHLTFEQQLHGCDKYKLLECLK